jgi:uncharacterized protein (DUF924 family)
LREFLYLPFMHSEHLADQLRCIELSRRRPCRKHEMAEHHAEIIRRFGASSPQPHLGRATTPRSRHFWTTGAFRPDDGT